MLYPEVDEEFIKKEKKKQELNDALKEQMALREQKKKEEKLKHLGEDQVMLRDINRYFGFGKQGGGAPLRDFDGKVNATRQNFMENGGNASKMNQFDMSFKERESSPNNYHTSVASKLNERAVSNSPTQNEVLHSKPSNMFEDITEDEFNRRER